MLFLEFTRFRLNPKTIFTNKIKIICIDRSKNINYDLNLDSLPN